MGKRRDGFVVTVVAVVVAAQGLLAGAAWFGRSATESRLAEQVLRNSDLRFQLARAQKQPVLKVEAAPPRWQLPDSPDAAGTMQAVQDLADRTGVQLDDLKATGRAAGKLSFQVVGHGTPHQLCCFLAGIEEHDRLIVVETGRVEPAKEHDIAFQLGLATWHRGGGQ